MQTEMHCGITTLTDEELKEIIKSEADDMNFEKAFDFMYEVAMKNEEEVSKLKPIEKNYMVSASCLYERICKCIYDLQ
ncbi:MAG: hypothetical protein K2P44_07995 [Lachnospiraceae bacterium]|nr:hypothetical protein [Lachnospiraceae bacterium]